DKIDRAIFQRGGFGGRVDAPKRIVRRQVFFASLTHGLVGLDAVNTVAVLQEQFTEEAGTGTNVGNDMARTKLAFVAQNRERLGWIAGAIPNVVGCATREALFGVGKAHFTVPRSLCALGLR